MNEVYLNANVEIDITEIVDKLFSSLPISVDTAETINTEAVGE